MKHAFSIYTKYLKAEMRFKNKEKNWDPIHREILAQTRRELAEYDGKGEV